MFMAKGELKNTMQLIKIKLDNTKRNRLWFLLVAFIMISAILIPTLIAVFKQANGVTEYKLQDYSIAFTVGTLIGITVLTCMYRTNNQPYSVYPQTNTSRFLSSQAIWYIWIFLIAAVSLLLYLIQYAVFAAIAGFRTNVMLVYRFDLGFIVTGFFVLIIYAAIITAMITLVAVIIRRFRIYAILSLGVLAALIITNMIKMTELSGKALGFLIFENNPALFILKGVILWAFLFGVSLFINKNTVYYKSGMKISKAILAVIAVVGIIAIGITPFVIFKSTPSQSIRESENEIQESHRWNEIVIDASSVPDGTNINIVAPNITMHDARNEFTTYNGENMDMYLDFEMDIFKGFNGEKIIIRYCLPSPAIDYYELSKLANPNFSARLEGNTLYLDYSYEKNIKAVFIPVWSFMWQFDGYKGKEIFKEFIGSSYSSGNGTVFISVE